jgi:hypothetical protein
MDAALNEFMLVGVNIILRENPTKKEPGDKTLHSEFQIIGQLAIDDFNELRKAVQGPALVFRCDFGDFTVELRHLEYDSIKETFSLYLVSKD